jgi:hypothetical protein
MHFRQYPVIIKKEGDAYQALCPDLQLGVVIHGYESIADVCGAAMSSVHMCCTALKAEKRPLPPATPMEEAQQLRPEGFVMCIRVIVAQAEECDGIQQ